MSTTKTVGDEFTRPLGGVDYTFHWGIDDIEELQERLALFAMPLRAPSLQEIDDGIRQGRVRYRRAMIWAGLRKHHPGVDWAAAGRLMDQATLPELISLLGAFGFSITPDPEDIKALEAAGAKKKNPRKAQTTTAGADSTSKPEASV